MRLILKLINKFSKCISCCLRALMVHEGLGPDLFIKIISQKKNYKVCKYSVKICNNDTSNIFSCILFSH